MKCEHCKGKGIIKEKKALVNKSWEDHPQMDFETLHRCHVCNGTGKTDWVANITKSIHPEYGVFPHIG